MDQRTQQLLASFAQCENKHHLLPDDWRRFFDLAVHVHRHRILLTGQHVRLQLAACGFSAEASARLGWMFELFAELLIRYDQKKV
jgi:hypothetical protein